MRSIKPKGKPSVTPLPSLLIANRSEIALRIHRTTHPLISTTTLFTPPDSTQPHAQLPSAIPIGSYLDGRSIIEIAKKRGIRAIHPGYGFLSENAEFSRMCREAGIVFVGPSPESIEGMGDKARSKGIMEKAGVPCVPGYHGAEQTEDTLAEFAKKVGFPVLLKSVKGGGGKGMRIVWSEDEFSEKLQSARSEAMASFGPGGDKMIIERYIQRPRHIEVQVFADSHGNIITLGERDCSIQRRHQKVLEETPAPGILEELREALWETAKKAAKAVDYLGAGTVEFIVDVESGKFFFMEMNTRLQVEHPVTEAITGVDLVEWQMIVAAGGELPLSQEEVNAEIEKRGAAMEVRVYSEKPDKGFLPDSGTLTHLQFPKDRNVRVDKGYREGDKIGTGYDGMIAKVIVSGETREIARRRLAEALAECRIAGVGTNVEFLKRVVEVPEFIEGGVETGFIKGAGPELFREEKVDDEVFVQAAISMWGSGGSGGLGFGGSGERGFIFEVMGTEEKVGVSLSQTEPTQFAATVTRYGEKTKFPSISTTITTLSATSISVTSLFPESRQNTIVIPTPETPDSLTLFHGPTNRQHTLTLQPPLWLFETLGVHETSGAVVTPMPCKVVRVEVNEGDQVEKGTPLVIVESMKMEMVVKATGKGTVGRVRIDEGDVLEGGVVIVEMEENQV